MLSQLQDSSQVDYINVGSWLIDNGGYNKSNGRLDLYSQETQQISLRILTDHTDYFEKVSQGYKYF
ncbi:2'-deoxycytidine 5'-triphosphate deaminase [Vibrio parahaemolyticus]|nr:2'-deoxycytidine 5'-triphosphate deaminase [Vibrio parahaemolyticus]